MHACGRIPPRDCALEVQLLHDRISRAEADANFWYWFAMFSLFTPLVALAWLLVDVTGKGAC
jgi:hypothetical protein